MQYHLSARLTKKKNVYNIKTDNVTLNRVIETKKTSGFFFNYFLQRCFKPFSRNNYKRKIKKKYRKLRVIIADSCF